MRWVSTALVVLALLPAQGPAQTNVNADAGNADAAQFFAKYKQAIALLDKKKHQEAGITMDVLSRTLSTSPWLELAILKHAQLVETTNEKFAEQDYALIRQRIENAPYYQGDTERAKLLGAALKGTVEQGVNRIRLRRVRDAVQTYNSQHGEFPESLTKLVILGYVDQESIHAVNNQLFRYTPQMPQLAPVISYRTFTLESVPSEPFHVTSPKIEGTSQISEKPLKYSALIKVPGQADPARIVEDQTLEGYFVAAIAHDGVLVCTPTRVLVLVAP